MYIWCTYDVNFHDCWPKWMCYCHQTKSVPSLMVPPEPVLYLFLYFSMVICRIASFGFQIFHSSFVRNNSGLSSLRFSVFVYEIPSLIIIIIKLSPLYVAFHLAFSLGCVMSRDIQLVKNIERDPACHQASHSAVPQQEWINPNNQLIPKMNEYSWEICNVGVN